MCSLCPAGEPSAAFPLLGLHQSLTQQQRQGWLHLRGGSLPKIPQQGLACNYLNKFHLLFITAAHWSQNGILLVFFFSLIIKSLNTELWKDGMCLAGTQVIPEGTSPFHVIRIIGTVLSGGPRPADQHSASVLGINSSETKLNKSAD